MTAQDLRAAKARLGCTWVKLATALSLSERTLRRYGDGAWPVPPPVAEAIAAMLARRTQADALRVQADELAAL